MLLANKKIAIVGGGPGGLTLAILLQQKGIDVNVYERDVNAAHRVQGATLDLHYGSGLKAIEAAGLMEAFKANYRPGADIGRVVDKHANILYDEHAAELIEDTDSEYWHPEIDRGTLRDLLLNALEPNAVIWDSQLTKVESAGNSWKMEFKNGTTATADIVIGADGANSKIRPLVTPIQYNFAGITIVQGNVENSGTTIPQMHELLRGGKIYAHGDNKYIHISSKGDGSIDFYLSLKTGEHNDIQVSTQQQAITWFNEEFPDWDSIWKTLFKKAAYPLYLRPQYCMPVNQTWQTQANITLLGDAAHLMPPSGEGVNLAMLDALELSECLTNDYFKDTKSAIASYEKTMQERAITGVKDAMDMADWMHGGNALTKLIKMFNRDE